MRIVVYKRKKRKKKLIVGFFIALLVSFIIVACLKVYTVDLPIYTQDLVKIYKNDSQFEANIGVANETVTFEINSRNYTKVSDENGTASIAINLGPGNYSIKTTFNGTTVENTITVLPTLIAENLVKYFRNASQFYVTLIDGQGNPVAGQNITMNINGVEITSMLVPGHTNGGMFFMFKMDGKTMCATGDTVLDAEGAVSMNFWGLTPAYLPMLEADFVTFLQGIAGNELKAEYLLPGHIGDLLKQGKVTVKVLPTPDKWFGVTYAEDKPLVVESFKELYAAGAYEADLFSDL